MPKKTMVDYTRGLTLDQFIGFLSILAAAFLATLDDDQYAKVCQEAVDEVLKDCPVFLDPTHDHTKGG